MKNYGYVLILISDSEFLGNRSRTAKVPDVVLKTRTFSIRKFQDGIMRGIGL